VLVPRLVLAVALLFYPVLLRKDLASKVFLSHMPTCRKFLFLPVVMVIRFFSRVARLTGFS